MVNFIVSLPHMSLKSSRMMKSLWTLIALVRNGTRIMFSDMFFKRFCVEKCFLTFIYFTFIGFFSRMNLSVKWKMNRTYWNIGIYHQTHFYTPQVLLLKNCYGLYFLGFYQVWRESWDVLAVLLNKGTISSVRRSDFSDSSRFFRIFDRKMKNF